MARRIPKVKFQNNNGIKSACGREQGGVKGARWSLKATNTKEEVESDMGEFKRAVGNRYSARQGDDSRSILGNLEFSAGGWFVRSNQSMNNRFDPKATATGAAADRNNDKQRIDAMRSGFNDNRDDPSIFDILKEFVELPVDLLKAIIPIDSKKISNVTNTGKPVGKNSLTNLYDSIKDEVKKITSAFSIISADAAAKQAKVVLKAKKERIKVMQEKLKKIKDPNIIQRLSKNIASLLSGPSTENASANLKSTADKDEIAKAAGEVVAKQAKPK